MSTMNTYRPFWQTSDATGLSLTSDTASKTDIQRLEALLVAAMSDAQVTTKDLIAKLEAEHKADSDKLKAVEKAKEDLAKERDATARALGESVMREKKSRIQLAASSATAEEALKKAVALERIKLSLETTNEKLQSDTAALHKAMMDSQSRAAKTVDGLHHALSLYRTELAQVPWHNEKAGKKLEVWFQAAASELLEMDGHDPEAITNLEKAREQVVFAFVTAAKCYPVSRFCYAFNQTVLEAPFSTPINFSLVFAGYLLANNPIPDDFKMTPGLDGIRSLLCQARGLGGIPEEETTLTASQQALVAALKYRELDLTQEIMAEEDRRLFEALDRLAVDIIHSEEPEWKQALWRTIAKQSLKAVHEPLVALLARKGIEAHRVRAFLTSTMGRSLLAVMVGLAIEQYGEDENLWRLGLELRVLALDDAMDSLVDIVAAPLREVLTEAIKGEEAPQLEVRLLPPSSGLTLKEMKATAYQEV